ncbi:ribosomal-protein-alanine N-acetyltransferase [Roseovarius sp. MBR-79]|jgi:ribosomal-protein-alanine N-acetyltransferase
MPRLPATRRRPFSMTPEALADTHARAFAGQGRAWSAAEFAALLASPHVFVSGDARGFALGRVIADEAELLTLATDPGHRRQGHARACLCAFAAEARARGAETAFLEVAEDNAAALALYAGAGFAQTARREGYYPGGRTAVVMQKHL